MAKQPDDPRPASPVPPQGTPVDPVPFRGHVFPEAETPKPSPTPPVAPADPSPRSFARTKKDVNVTAPEMPTSAELPVKPKRVVHEVPNPMAGPVPLKKK